MNNNDQDSPTDNGVDRAPILAFIKELIDAGANVNARTRELSPGRRWLYSLNDVSWVDFTGQTPFLRAALSGDTATMRLLVERGADPNLPTLAGTTPLMAAAGVNWVVAQTYTESLQARLDAVKLCLELGADVNATNSMGLTALLGAVEPRIERHHRAARRSAARGSTSRTRKDARRCAGRKACSSPRSAPSASRRRSRCSSG